jgi:hypothetical protein
VSPAFIGVKLVFLAIFMQHNSLVEGVVDIHQWVILLQDKDKMIISNHTDKSSAVEKEVNLSNDKSILLAIPFTPHE